MPRLSAVGIPVLPAQAVAKAKGGEDVKGKKTILAGLFLISSYAHAQQNAEQVHMPNQYLSCFENAALIYHVPEKVLIGIARVESRFNPYAYHRNTNGTLDVGIMQINSMHIPFLEQHGVRANELWDACTNIKVGAWVLAQQIHRHGSTWRAVGAYNAHDEQKRKEYARKVWVAINRRYP